MHFNYSFGIILWLSFFGSKTKIWDLDVAVVSSSTLKIVMVAFIIILFIFSLLARWLYTAAHFWRDSHFTGSKFLFGGEGGRARLKSPRRSFTHIYIWIMLEWNLYLVLKKKKKKSKVTLRFSINIDYIFSVM